MDSISWELSDQEIAFSKGDGMRILNFVGAAALLSVATGCVDVSDGGPSLASRDTQSANCVAAVREQTNNPDVVVLGSDPRGSQREFSLEVGGMGIWSCSVGPTGVVSSVFFLGSDGSPLA